MFLDEPMVRPLFPVTRVSQCLKMTMPENDDAWSDMPGKPAQPLPDDPRPQAIWSLPGVILVWALLMAAVISALAAYQYVSLLGELERQSDALQAEVSRRADQHDAHVTALSAVAQAEQGADYGLLLDVAAPFCSFIRALMSFSWCPQ